MKLSQKKKKVFINFFPKAAKELKTQNISNFMQNESNDSLKEALNYFEKKKKKSFVNIKRKFLNINKACQNIDIPTKTVS